ncbi:MAG: peptide chain release factor N(5)-glutamine methyltransferase [Arenimonas sp.]
MLQTAIASLPDDSPRADAELLLAAAVGRTRSWLYAHSDTRMDPAAHSRFSELLRRRSLGEPVAFILGSREFWSLELKVTVDTLIPRPETELLVELALALLPQRTTMTVLELGTGTGAIALAIAHERPQARVAATDAVAATLDVARKNASCHGMTRVRFALGDWYQAVAGERFGLIVSNPPYIADADPHLLRGDLRFEPRRALVSGSDGLDAIRVIAAAAPQHLTAGGHILLEHGFAQGGKVRELLSRAGLVDVRTHLDLEGRERVTAGRLPT